MKKVVLFSVFLLCGIVLSQVLPGVMGDSYLFFEKVFKNLMLVCLAFIMINVGREFDLDKKKWRSYT
ncbi:MAG: sodium:proton antiporter, partial [Odoribacter sp.]|nr:sodium:proton antiporter [Odoribacter sp.]